MNSSKRLTGQVLFYGTVVIVTVMCLFPIIFTLLTSFKPNREMYLYPPTILPKTWTLEAYISILSKKKYLLHFFNAWVISSCATIVCVILGAFAGYGFSRYRLPAKRFLMLGILALQMFPGAVLMIPYFRLARTLHLYNTYLGLILINCGFVLPLAIWLLRSFFDSIPIEVEEAAMIDGCTRGQAILYVIAPLARAGVIAIGIMTFLKAWNEFLFALILTQGPEKAPISVGLAGLFTSYNVKLNALMAITVLSILPLMLIFIFLQRYIISGITGGAVK